MLRARLQRAAPAVLSRRSKKSTTAALTSHSYAWFAATSRATAHAGERESQRSIKVPPTPAL